MKIEVCTRRVEILRDRTGEYPEWGEDDFGRCGIVGCGCEERDVFFSEDEVKILKKAAYKEGIIEASNTFKKEVVSARQRMVQAVQKEKEAIHQAGLLRKDLAALKRTIKVVQHED